MSRMTPEEIRLRDEAIAAGRVVKPAVKKAAPLKPTALPDRVALPRPPTRTNLAARRSEGVRTVSIQRALEWAFGAEHARLEFDELNETSGNQRQGIDGIWLMMQRGAIGCEIDGGGRSDPAWDAEIIASTVANLPVGHGGRRMAVFVAELARAGIAPDWIEDAAPHWFPCETHQNQFGWTAATAEAQHLGSEGWPVIKRVGRKGRVLDEPVLYCPVYVAPTAQQIGAARRRYLEWWGALLWIAGELQTLRILHDIEITQDMPPMTPWRANSG